MTTSPKYAPVSQKTEFLADEGDQWFMRNKSALAGASQQRDCMVQHIADQLRSDAASTVLEIGCGQGANLEHLARLRPVNAHGIDPSTQAVLSGGARNSALHLQVGTADDLPYADQHFDVVWFGFCLYLVDRDLLQRVVAEADRVLRDGGLLAITDFDPPEPCRRPYHHKAGLYSYKMDYSRLFLANPSYALVQKISTGHTSGGWAPDPQERIALYLCRKNPEQAYRLV